VLAGAAALAGDAAFRGSGSVALAIPLALVACLPLAWSRRAPLPALLATTAGLIVCLAAFQPYHTAIFVLAVALYNVASLGDRRRSLIVGAATAAFVVVVIVVIADNVAVNTAIRLGVVFAALVLGDTVRSRRELREARREEREQENRRRVADERLRIARDLHDTVAHALVAIPIAVGQTGFRIVQEALTNVMRHAAASHARVNLHVEAETLHVEVTDDGNAAAPTQGGHGLRGMRERAAALGGDVTAGPAEHGGWQVHARLPLKPAKR